MNNNIVSKPSELSPIEVVEQKLVNFKQHLTDSIKRAGVNIEINGVIDTVTLEYILNTVKTETALGKSAVDMTDELLRYYALDKTKFKYEDIARTTRYFEYFILITS